MPHLIDNISDIELLLINVVHFNCKWQFAFDESLTVKGKFSNADGSVVDVDMMTQTQVMKYYERRGVQVVEVPYAEDGVSAVIIVVDDLSDFVETLNDSEVNKIFKGLKEQKVTLQLPRFELESEVAVIANLKEMGIDRAFDKMSADLANVTNHIKLHVNKMVHRTFLKVSEEGRVSGKEGGCCGGDGGDKGREMVVDRPFLFMVRDREAEGNMVLIAKVEKL